MSLPSPSTIMLFGSGMKDPTCAVAEAAATSNPATSDGSHPPAQHRDKREEPAGRCLIDLDLAGEALGHELRALVVERGALAVDRLDLARARGADGGIIGLAGEKIV